MTKQKSFAVTDAKIFIDKKSEAKNLQLKKESQKFSEQNFFPKKLPSQNKKIFDDKKSTEKKHRH